MCFFEHHWALVQFSGATQASCARDSGARPGQLGFCKLSFDAGSQRWRTTGWLPEVRFYNVPCPVSIFLLLSNSSLLPLPAVSASYPSLTPTHCTCWVQEPVPGPWAPWPLSNGRSPLAAPSLSVVSMMQLFPGSFSGPWFPFPPWTYSAPSTTALPDDDFQSPSWAPSLTPTLIAQLSLKSKRGLHWVYNQSNLVSKSSLAPLPSTLSLVRGDFPPELSHLH